MNQNKLKEIHNHILKIANTQRAETNKWFFKTGPGEYGEGDKFIGLTVPQTRKLVEAFNDINLIDTEKLLKSEFHEERLLALLMMVDKFKKSKNIKEKEEIFNLYFKNIKYVNNWDLVDTSAYNIVGEYIKEKYSLNTKNCSGVKFLNSLVIDKYKFAKKDKEKLWEKRIGIVSTFAFMQKPFKNEYSPKIIFEVVSKILNEKDQSKDSLNNHDLIQKASGWMLREYGKRVNEKDLKDYLKNNFKKIKDKRTLLRYAIERMSENDRRGFLKT